MIKVGDKVTEIRADISHVGKVEELRPSKDGRNINAYVRWHRGFASWKSCRDLVAVNEGATRDQ